MINKEGEREVFLLIKKIKTEGRWSSKNVVRVLGRYHMNMINFWELKRKYDVTVRSRRKKLNLYRLFIEH